MGATMTFCVGFSYQLRDAAGITANTDIFANVADATTITQLRAAWIALGQLLDNCTDAKITRGRLTLGQSSDPGFKALAAAGSIVDLAGVLQFNVAASLRTWPIVIPALGASQYTAQRVNLNAVALHALINQALQGTGSSNTYVPSNPQGLTFSSIQNGFRGERSHRKQYNSKTNMSGGSYVP